MSRSSDHDFRYGTGLKDGQPRSWWRIRTIITVVQIIVTALIVAGIAYGVYEGVRFVWMVENGTYQSVPMSGGDEMSGDSMSGGE